MKTITITEANINSVFGRLKKFFYNNNKTGFTSWHNFNCGFKRINPIVELNGDKMRLERTYPAPLDVSMFTEYAGGKAISISLTASDGFTLHSGDKIAFLGNRIVTRTDWIYSFGKAKEYCYTVYQVLPMSAEKQEDMQERAKEEDDAYWDAYEEDLGEYDY